VIDDEMDIGKKMRVNAYPNQEFKRGCLYCNKHDIRLEPNVKTNICDNKQGCEECGS
jgi:hypothetical protein